VKSGRERPQRGKDRAARGIEFNDAGESAFRALVLCIYYLVFHKDFTLKQALRVKSLSVTETAKIKKEFWEESE